MDSDELGLVIDLRFSGLPNGVPSALNFCFFIDIDSGPEYLGTDNGPKNWFLISSMLSLFRRSTFYLLTYLPSLKLGCQHRHFDLKTKVLSF